MQLTSDGAPGGVYLSACLSHNHIHGARSFLFFTLMIKVGGKKKVITSFESRILLNKLGELFTTIQKQMMHRKHCIPLCSSMRNKIVIHIQMQNSSEDGNMCLLLYIHMSFASTPNNC